MLPYAFVGIQALVIAGTHTDIAGSQHGIGAGPLLQFRAGGRRLAVNLEGIPVVSVPNAKPSEAYGQATPALGIFNGQLEYATSADRTWWIGLGETIYNQRTPLPKLSQVVSSRLAGVRYTARYVHPTSAAHYVEAYLGVSPLLTGSDHYENADGTPGTEKPERASEVDASVSFAYVHNSTEWRVGIRSLNFAAKFINTGEGADRNVGIGPLIEWRHLFR